MPDDDLTHFTERVVRIIVNSCGRVEKDRRRFLEAHAVLANVCSSLRWIPAEPHGRSLRQARPQRRSRLRRPAFSHPTLIRGIPLRPANGPHAKLSNGHHEPAAGRHAGCRVRRGTATRDLQPA